MKLYGILIETNYLIPDRKPDLVLIQTEKNYASGSKFYDSVGPQSENKRNLKDWQILGPCQSTKKTVEHENVDDTKFCTLGTVHKAFEKKLAELKNQEE